MAYLFLTAAVAAEIVATTLLKASKGYTILVPTIFSIAIYLVCHFCFSKAVTGINLGIAYALWCGVGIIVTTLISVFVFKEAVSIQSIIGLGLVIAGCVVINLSGN